MLLEWTGALECSAKIECYFSFNCMTFYFSLINKKKKKKMIKCIGGDLCGSQFLTVAFVKSQQEISLKVHGYLPELQ